MDSDLVPTRPKLRIHPYLILLLLLAVVGLFDAGYLTADHYLNTSPLCSAFTDCDKILTSPYAMLWGFPLAGIGVLYYGSVIVLFLVYARDRHYDALRLAIWLVAIGSLISIWLLYLQFYVLRALCSYCILSAATSWLLLLFGLGIARRPLALHR